MIEIYNAKTGRTEKVQHVWVQTAISKHKEHIHDDKRSAAVVEQQNDANSKTALAAKQRVLSFLTMSADDNFFKATWTLQTVDKVKRQNFHCLCTGRPVGG